MLATLTCTPIHCQKKKLKCVLPIHYAPLLCSNAHINLFTTRQVLRGTKKTKYDKQEVQTGSNVYNTYLRMYVCWIHSITCSCVIGETGPGVNNGTVIATRIMD